MPWQLCRGCWMLAEETPSSVELILWYIPDGLSPWVQPPYPWEIFSRKVSQPGKGAVGGPTSPTFDLLNHRHCAGSNKVMKWVLHFHHVWQELAAHLVEHLYADKIGILVDQRSKCNLILLPHLPSATLIPPAHNPISLTLHTAISSSAIPRLLLPPVNFHKFFSGENITQELTNCGCISQVKPKSSTPIPLGLHHTSYQLPPAPQYPPLPSSTNRPSSPPIEDVNVEGSSATGMELTVVGLDISNVC
ncbi:hypothetical protein BDR05DRAFT_944715 [Suillus weaverae]|nr:hypothetical protein BDR05DRAFT_944715 [Suillus weaverae]